MASAFASCPVQPEKCDTRNGDTGKKSSDECVMCSSCNQCKSDSRSSSENPLHTWLAMDKEHRDRHMKHMKNCIMSPFLFGKRMNYSAKIINWLKYMKLVPRSSRRSSFPRSFLTDRFIEVADVVEEIVDNVLSSLMSEDFLHNSYHSYKELANCYFVKDALAIAEKSEFVLLMGYCFSGNHCLDDRKIQFLSLAILHQAMKHICRTNKPGDFVTKFEEAARREEGICRDLRLKGNSHFAVGEFETAVACYSQAIKFSPFDPFLYGNRAQSYLKLKKLREALSDAKRTVYLKPEWEKGHYRFAQAYFELGFHEKAMAVNSFAQKCCSSTLNLLCQAVVFKRETDELDRQKRAQYCSSGEERTPSDYNDQHRAACVNFPSSSSTKVGNKRKWKIANGTETLNCTDVKLDTADVQIPSSIAGDDDIANRNRGCSKDENSEPDLSDDDSIPSLVCDSSDDCDDAGHDLSSTSPDSNVIFSSEILSDLPGLTSGDESDTESDDSDSEFDDDDDDNDDDLCCSDDECDFFDCSCDDDADDDNDDDDDVYTDMDAAGESESDRSVDDVDLLRAWMLPSILNNEIDPLVMLDGVIRGFLTAHPEMLNEGSPPALPQVIESLPKAQVSKQQLAASLSCAICQCDYEENETVLELPCSHLFHPPCITTWLKMHATCPTCRDVLPH